MALFLILMFTFEESREIPNLSKYAKENNVNNIQNEKHDNKFKSYKITMIIVSFKVSFSNRNMYIQ